MSVHEIKRTSLLDVRAKLRELAAQIEALGEPFSVIVVVGRPNGRVSVRAFGERTSPLEMSGWLARAFTVLTEGSAEETPFADSPSPTPPAA